MSLIWAGNSFAQKTQYFEDPERILKDGIDLFQKEKYGTAQTHFSDFIEAPVIHGTPKPSQYALGEAHYYYAACAVELFQNDARQLMEKFILEYPESPKVPLAQFQLGKLFFRSKKYKEAISRFLQTDIYQLTKAQYAEYCFKLGYSFYMTDDWDNALLQFEKIKDEKNLYQIPAIYYYAHICYLQQKYEIALEHFLRIQDDKNFSKIVPFYIAQIYFIQKKYQEAIDYARPISDTLTGPNKGLVKRILAESYFELKDYTNSVKYYNEYLAAGETLDRTGHYKFGLSLYFTGDCDGAIDQLKNATSENDEVSQTAYYYLADCLIKTDQKRAALDALKFSYTYDYDKDISKEARYNYARLSYELGYDPYNEAIDALNDYINLYPDDPDLDEAYELLANIYLNTHNYKDALTSIGKVKVKNTNLKIAEQRIFLFRGMELFNNMEYDQAIEHFKEAISKNYDPKVAATAKFWMGDAYYRKGNYTKAVSIYNGFLSTPGALSIIEYPNAFYNLGYAYFKQKKYSKALTEFKTFIDKAAVTDRKIDDAYVRVADCYFMNKNYNRAIEYYNKAVHTGSSSQDYALMQKANILGLNGKYSEKALTLEKILKENSNSGYQEVAMYELGLTYLRLSRFNDAEIIFTRLVNEKPQSVYRSRACLQIGLIYRQAGNHREALGWFKKVVDEYGNTPYQQEALKYIKDIYIEDLGDYDAWSQYASTLNIELNHAAEDSLAFAATEVALNSGDCSRITEAMGKYLNKFPSGIFSLDAHNYKGNCHLSLQQWDQAAASYEKVLGYPKNNYTEDALNNLVEIYEYQRDSTNLERVYGILEQVAASPTMLKKAKIGLMRIKYSRHQYYEALDYAKAVLTFGNLDPSIEHQAKFISGKCYMELNDQESAQSEFRYFKVRTSSEYYPEAMYYYANIQYNKGLYRDAEKTLTKAVQYMGGQKDWLARSFILLSDVYVALGDLVQAKAVLQTVIDNHDGQDLVNLAQQKLDAIIEMERMNNRSMNNNDWELDMNNGKNPKNENNIPN